MRLTDNEFQGILPRVLFGLIDEHLDMIEYKATVAALAYHGQPLPRRIKEEPAETFEVHPDAF